MQLPVKNMSGQQVGVVELNDAVFAAPINTSLMHQALLRQLANARQGTHSTKERGEVAGGGKKPWRQKGTGRARQGSIRAPNFIGGGVVFGPKPRKYTQSMPKKMHKAAIRSALSVKADAGKIVIVDAVATDQYKTKVITAFLKSLSLTDQRVLMVLNEKVDTIWRSAGNVPALTTLLSGYINVRDLLGNDVVVLSSDAVAHIELWLTDGLTIEESIVDSDDELLIEDSSLDEADIEHAGDVIEEDVLDAQQSEDAEPQNVQSDTEK